MASSKQKCGKDGGGDGKGGKERANITLELRLGSIMHPRRP